MKYDMLLPPTMKRCPGCGIIIEKIGVGDAIICGCEPRSKGGDEQKALKNGGCGHEFNFKTLAAISNGKPGDPANERQVRFKVN